MTASAGDVTASANTMPEASAQVCSGCPTAALMFQQEEAESTESLFGNLNIKSTPQPSHPTPSVTEVRQLVASIRRS